jgi:predicted permease
MSDITQALLVSIKSVVTLATIVLVGVLSVKHEVLDRQAVGVVAKLMNTVLLPCFFVGKDVRSQTFSVCNFSLADILGKGLSVAKFEQLWPLVIGGIVLQASGVAVGWLVSLYARPQPFFRKWFILAFAFPNVVALPFVLLESICANQAAEMGYATARACADEGGLMVFMFILTLDIGIFVVAFEWVAERAPSAAAPARIAGSAAPAPIAGADLETSLSKDPARPEAADAGGALAGTGTGAGSGSGSASRPSGCSQGARAAAAMLQRAFLKPAVVAQFTGIAIGLIRPLQHSCFDVDGLLSPIVAAAVVLGKATVPAVNLVMAASVGCKLMDMRKREAPLLSLLGSEELGISRRTMACLLVGVPSFHMPHALSQRARSDRSSCMT